MTQPGTQNISVQRKTVVLSDKCKILKIFPVHSLYSHRDFEVNYKTHKLQLTTEKKTNKFDI